MLSVRGPMLFAMMVFSCACSGAAEPPPPNVPPAPAPPPVAPVEACAFAAECAAAGKEAHQRKDLDGAARLLGIACEKGHMPSCIDAAQALVDRPGGAKGHEIVPWLERGCEGRDAPSCNGLGQLWHRAGNDREAARAFGKGCDTQDATACHNLGVVLASGTIPRDDALLATARERACKAGSQADCAPAPPAPDKPAPAPTKLPGANLNVDGMVVDGVLIETLSCKVDGLGLLGAVVVGATLAKQRNALRACGVQAPVPVGWTIQRGAVVDASASSGDTKKDACIVRALKQIKSTSDGTCRATVGLK
ncbi:Hypothetical protein A7982_11034 [Minicystis rosea]|nr:Hypothetical protein A7982_11034 [Minicystis rosea]